MTAYRWFREGKLPVPARPAGRLILVDQPPVSAVQGITAVDARVKTGIDRGEWARERPSASSSSQPKSWVSPTIMLKAVSQIVTQHSSAIVIRRCLSTLQPD